MVKRRYWKKEVSIYRKKKIDRWKNDSEVLI